MKLHTSPADFAPRTLTCEDVKTISRKNGKGAKARKEVIGFRGGLCGLGADSLHREVSFSSFGDFFTPSQGANIRQPRRIRPHKRRAHGHAPLQSWPVVIDGMPKRGSVSVCCSGGFTLPFGDAKSPLRLLRRSRHWNRHWNRLDNSLGVSYDAYNYVTFSHLP